MEEQAQLPTQMQMHMVVMLPKNATIERPITLTSTLWRTWCRLRKPVLDQWQRTLPMAMDHDKARPGANVLFVALERLLRQEVHRARGRHGITVLMDMSTFYDTIPLEKLQQEAIKLNYPPLHLELAMQLYTGPKAISAEQEFTPFFRVDRGIPAGCPQAPLLAKAVLAPALVPWREEHPNIHLTSWVDDIGYDTHGRSPLQVATRAAYRDLHTRLQQLGLRVNAKKTAFLATDKATDRELKALLQPHEPQVVTVMRDLGIDHQAARRRRIPVLKQRFAKAHPHLSSCVCSVHRLCNGDTLWFLQGYGHWLAAVGPVSQANWQQPEPWWVCGGLACVGCVSLGGPHQAGSEDMGVGGVPQWWAP